LTKNISMGGNVESNALSAYTAGSGRQQRIIDDDGGSTGETTFIPTSGKSTNEAYIPPRKGHLHEDISSGDVVAPSINDDAGVTIANSSATMAVAAAAPSAAASTAVDSSDDAQINIASADTHTAAVSEPSSATSSLLVSKEDQISAAKLRYLARKKS
jgi:hypothetical protein